jgi:hypothetical protein
LPKSDLFLLPGAAGHDPAVDAWLHVQVPDLGVIAQGWFSVMRACGGDVRETIHDGAATACVSDAAFAYVAVFQAHVNVGFFYGAFLPDPACLLQGTGKRMRHVKVRPGAGPDVDALTALIHAAYADIRTRITATTTPERA